MKINKGESVSGVNKNLHTYIHTCIHIYTYIYVCMYVCANFFYFDFDKEDISCSLIRLLLANIFYSQVLKLL
jgi:hypothetical protein